MKKSLWIVIVAAAAVTGALRLGNIPTLNFSAMGAFAVLCGATVRPAILGLVLPLGLRLITDLVLEVRTGHGFYGSMLFDYLAYSCLFLIGAGIRPRSLVMAAGAGLSAASVFFVLSNLGVWCMPHEGSYLYPRTLDGLIACYINGIPFARGTFLGDTLFTVAFFLPLTAGIVARDQSASTTSKPVTEPVSNHSATSHPQSSAPPV